MTLRAFRRRLDNTLIAIAVALFSIGIVTTLLGTLSRNFTLFAGFTWTDEVTRFTIIAGVYVIIGIGYRKGLQISFTLISARLPEPYTTILSIINNLFVTGFFGLVLYYGFEMAMSNRGQISPVLEIPMVYPYMILPIGALLILSETVVLLVRRLRRLIGKRYLYNTLEADDEEESVRVDAV